MVVASPADMVNNLRGINEILVLLIPSFIVSCKKNVYLDVVPCTLKIVAIALSFLKNLWGFNSPAFNGNRDLMQCNASAFVLFAEK